MAIYVNGPAEFDAEFDRHDGLILALFTGQKDRSTGVSWCPDCTRAEPFIQRAIERNPGTIFLHCDVGPRDSWKDQPNHPYRNMANTRVRCVPTLIRYQNHREIARLEEAQICNDDILSELFS